MIRAAPDALAHVPPAPPARSGAAATLVCRLRTVLLRHGDARERGHVVYIDRARRLVGESAMGPGSIASLVLNPRDILAAGFRLGACGMILAHNHPSGDCRPSRADLEATERLAWLGQMVDLRVLDHLIVTPSATYSMRAGGVL